MKSCPTCGSKSCYHLKSMVKSAKDGKGGPGFNPIASQNPIAPANPLQGGASAGVPAAGGPPPSLPPMSPGMGTAITPGSFSPQQGMQMAAQGMMPAGSGATPPMSRPLHVTNKPHRVLKTTGGHKLRKAHLKSAVTKVRRPVF